MTNDTTTLNGALQELGELMSTNLNMRGVTASASDGLTTLANKINDIGVYLNDDATTDKSMNYSHGGTTITHDNNGYVITSTGNNTVIFLSNVKDCICEFKVKPAKNPGIMIGDPTWGTGKQHLVYKSDGRWYHYYNVNNSISTVKSAYGSISSSYWYTFRATIQSNLFSFEVIRDSDNTTMFSSSSSNVVFGCCFGFFEASATTNYVKDIKVTKL